ncbi:type IV pili methyl-accepting chemotaxis transducer N-terminal domain-containing protein [Piscinibacter sakaiensis]|uniref:type IV pili methyl-accepting chemotaxis transducer N-terminal domain-containing protein n=1 Tax=Piscinibacter sakaiensis TaxID=1547922 RepID=UPI003AAC4142
MQTQRHWTLGAKLALIAAPFLMLATVSIAALVWMSSQLEGGAAAVNEAGSMRMQAYRLVLSARAGNRILLERQAAAFDDSLALLREGDPARPLAVPWSLQVHEQFAVVEEAWAQYRRHLLAATGATTADAVLEREASLFVGLVGELVAAIEQRLAQGSAMMNLLQLFLLALAVTGTGALVYVGHRFVLEPVGQLKAAARRVQAGELGARVELDSTDEFGTLADGFNQMADRLQTVYQNLEERVREKTAQLVDKHQRLESLYEVTNLVNRAVTLDQLAGGFARSIASIARADGVALRWSDEGQQRHLMLASHRLPAAMLEAEHCLTAGECHCGAPATAAAAARVIPIRSDQPAPLSHCAEANFNTLVALPIRLHGRQMGEVDLFFHAQHELADAERSLLEALTVQLAGAMENLRLGSLEVEAAVAQERSMLAGELHDSIAQSLAFLKIQVQLLREALDAGDAAEIDHALEEIDLGVRESYGDVRELLIHFRTRTNGEDIEPALQTTLRKFEHQSGQSARLTMRGHGLPLPPDTQVQVLHIVQEALSNVRKHARASQVWLDIDQQPTWRFEVRDDGIGFSPERDPDDETHVGLRIMKERAARLGASLDVLSTPGRGTSVVLCLPTRQSDAATTVAETEEAIA